MLQQLQTNLETIHSEIMEKLIPENLKKGVTLLNVTGTLEGTDTILEVTGDDATVENATLILTGVTPGDYTELEYIQSTGTQYIDTEFYPNGNTRVQCKWTNGSSNGVVFGAYNGDWTTGFGFYAAEANSQGTYFRHYFSNDDTGLTKTIIMEIDMNKGSLAINGTSYFTTDTKSFTLNYPMYIFCGNWRGRLEQPVSTQLCYFKIWDNDVLVRDLIPVKRKINNTVCLYDKITHTFFCNQGTNDFIAGPEK